MDSESTDVIETECSESVEVVELTTDGETINETDRRTTDEMPYSISMSEPEPIEAWNVIDILKNAGMSSIERYLDITFKWTVFTQTGSYDNEDKAE